MPKQTWQEYKDQQLERHGLLNYQTKGLSQAEIAARFEQMRQNTGVGVQEKWFNDQYGQKPSGPAAPQPQQSAMQGGQADRPVFAPMQPATPAPVQPVIQYTTADNGLLIKAKNVQGKPVQVNLPGAPDPNFIAGPSLEDAQNGQANWTDVSVKDRTSLLTNPNFYKNNEITKYPAWMQQQILADPSFDWGQLPKWQKTFYSISSNPKIMAAPMAIAGAQVGKPFGLPGQALGALAGYGLGVIGGQEYDPTKGIAEQKTAVGKLMRGLNVLSQYSEQAIGYTGQVADAAIAGMKGNQQAAEAAKKMLFDPTTRQAAFDAAQLTYDYSSTGGRFLTNLFQVMSGETKFDPFNLDARNGKLAQSGQDFVIGASGPVDKEKVLGHNPLTGKEVNVTDVMGVLMRARNEIVDAINAGEDPDEVVKRYMQESSIYAGSQMQDLVWQTKFDPLNLVGEATSKAGETVARLGGNDVAAEAFRSTSGLNDAAQKYKTLVQTGEAMTIDPNFKTDQMGWFSRMVAGINEKGEVKAGSLIPSQKGLLDPIVNKTGFLEEMASQTPHSRAQTGAGMFYENIGTLLTMFEDPHEAGKYLSALSKGDNETWAQLGSKFAESPEFYTILPALKAFETEKLKGILQSWDITAPNREMLTNLANILGENPASLLEDLAKRGTSEQDFARVVERLKNSNSPEARAMLADVEAGKFTADTLKQTVDIFTGEGALSWHPGQWKASMLDALGDHFDEWVTKRLMLDKSPEATSAFFRTTALMKQAQSILLLGGSPGYAITNGLSNMVHRAATGIYGYLGPNQINDFIDRMGISPARFEEGVGIGGQVEMATGKSQVKMDAMTEAVKGKGPLTTAKDTLGKLSRGMPFSKLSAWFEKTESKQAFAIAMKEFWSQSWRRGVGFSKMAPELVGAIQEMGIPPERIYAAIEAGMNQGEIEKALFGRYEGVQARSLVNDAAQKTGLTAGQAADLLEKTGLMDALDKGLKGKTTRGGVQAVFERVNRQAQDWVDMQTGEDLKAMAESVKQRVGLEGAASALDVVQKATGAFTDAWMDHYARFGEVMTDLKLLDDPAQRSKAIDLNYDLSDKEFRRVYARHSANYKGIFEAWGLSGNPEALNVLAAIGEQDVAMLEAYRTMREIRKGFFEKYRNDWDNPAKWDEWDAGNKRIDKAFKDGFKAKHEAEVKQGAALAKIYENLYGPAAGEAARQWWEDVTRFNQEIVQRERDFRSSLEGLTREEREAAKYEYYSKDKLAQIAEVERINGEGIARLERVIKKGGGAGTPSTTTPPDNSPGGIDSLRKLVNDQYVPPTQPATPEELSTRLANVSGNADQLNVEKIAQAEAKQKQTQQNHVDELNALLAAAEQRKGAEAKANTERVNAVWDVAENYAREGLPYDRTVHQDYFALLNALRKPEYGGIPDLTGRSDPRLTPELVRQVLEARKTAKEAAAVQQVTQAMTTAADAAKNVKAPNIGDNTSILAAIKEHGGLSMAQALDITGEKRPKSAPGVFTSKGVGIDEMARMLADDGYPIDLNDPNDPGGIQQATALIQRQRKGDKVYPIGHDHEAMLARAQDQAAAKAFADSFDLANIPEVPFDEVLWQTELKDSIAKGDLTRMYEVMGNLPEELSTALTPDGETYVDFMSRVADETAARVEADARDEAVAGHASRAESAIADAEVHADAVTTRNLLKEQFQDVFGLSEDQAQAYMELSDAVAGWYEKVTGENADQFYARYYEDVVKAGPAPDPNQAPLGDGKDALYQIQPVNRKMTPAEIDGYARALVRAGEGELKSAIRNEASKADRRAILDAAHKLDPSLAENVAKQNLDLLFQGRKGAVTFGPDGIKATIHAFEARDFSTLVHENAHVFRRVLADVAARTDNPYIKADLGTIEKWAGVKDGKWDRAAEEKFARGFEEYVTTGRAPTPKLVKAFRTFKKFMLEIYQTIIGSDIDVNIAPEVRDVFGRMMGADGRTVADVYGNPLKVGERVVFGDKQMEVVNILDDGRAVLENGEGDSVISRPGQFEKMVTLTVEIDQSSRAQQATELKAGLIDSDFAERVRKLKEARAKANQTPAADDNPNILFQEASQPFGAYDAASQFHPQSEAMDQGWAQYVRPLMEAMQEGAVKQLDGKPLDGATKDMSPEGQAMLRSYMRKVQGEMATNKLATVRHGEQKRDFAMLNYNKRYGIDRVTETVLPYQFYQTRTMFNWGLRAVDKPAFYSNYARWINQTHRYENDLPERLRNKIKISAPWLPKWAGDALYIDPLGQLFPPAAMLRPFERMMQDKNYQQIEAERVLQEWAADGQYSQTEIQQAAESRNGTLYERAFAEAQIRRESEVNNPIDFLTSMFGPAWYLSTPLSLAGIKVFPNQGDKSKITTTPMYNTIRGIDTVTQGTWAEPIGNLIGALGKPEEWVRKKLNIPEFGEYGDYYIDRQLANMVAEGQITAEQAQVAMIERKGEFFSQAQERVKMELALRVPTMGALYAGLHSGPKAAAQAMLPSLFGASLLPAGELEYRGLKQEWNEAWSQMDKGNTGAINKFFDEHPEYEAYLAKGKPPEERLKSFLIGQIWDGYMALGPTNQKQARAEMGTLFAQSFLNKETRSYDTLDVNTLTTWAQLLGKMAPTPGPTPNSSSNTPAVLGESSQPAPKLNLLDKNVTGITDQFFEQRTRNFPNYYELQQGYYALPPSERTSYLLKNPEYAAYVKWRNNWYDAYPQYKPIFNGDAFDRVDTSNWPPMLEDFVRMYALTGQKLPSGAYKSLEQVWITEGQPMGDFKTWLNSTVVPSMMYGAPTP